MTDGKALRKRLFEKSQKNRELLDSNKVLMAENLELKNKYNREKSKAEFMTLTIRNMCARFGLDPDSDSFKKHVYDGSRVAIEIPENGLELSFLDEPVTVTRADFEGADRVSFYLFVSVVHKKHNPQRWRVAMMQSKLALVSRNLVDVKDIPLIYQNKEDEQKDSEQNEPIAKNLKRIPAKKEGDS